MFWSLKHKCRCFKSFLQRHRRGAFEGARTGTVDDSACRLGRSPARVSSSASSCFVVLFPWLSYSLSSPFQRIHLDQTVSSGRWGGRRRRTWFWSVWTWTLCRRTPLFAALSHISYKILSDGFDFCSFRANPTSTCPPPPTPHPAQKMSSGLLLPADMDPNPGGRGEVEVIPLQPGQPLWC